jgi:hypothetical protein
MVKRPSDATLAMTPPTAALVGRRICRACGEEQPLEDFPKAGRGRSVRCRSCTLAAAMKIGEKADGRRVDPQRVADQAAQSAERVAGVADRVAALKAAIHSEGEPEGKDGEDREDREDREDDPDPDVEHAKLLDPRVADGMKRYVRGVVKGTAALMVRDMVKAAVRETAERVVPELVAREVAATEGAPAYTGMAAPHGGWVAEREHHELLALLTALIERQPLDQRGWSCANERARWLAAFTAVLDVVFPLMALRGDGQCSEEVAHVGA